MGAHNTETIQFILTMCSAKLMQTDQMQCITKVI